MKQADIKKKIELSLDRLSARIDVLEAKTRNAEPADQMELKAVLEDLRQQHRSTYEQVTQFRDDGNEAVDDFTGALNIALADLENNVDEVSKRFE